MERGGNRGETCKFDIINFAGFSVCYINTVIVDVHNIIPDTREQITS